MPSFLGGGITDPDALIAFAWRESRARRPLSESLPLLTADPQLTRYGIEAIACEEVG